MRHVQIFELKNGSYVKSKRNSNHSSIEKALSSKKQLHCHIRCNQIYPRKNDSQKQIVYHKVRVMRSEHGSDIQTAQSTSKIIKLSCKIKQSDHSSQKIQTPKRIKGVTVKRNEGEQSGAQTAQKLTSSKKTNKSTIDIKNKILGTKKAQQKTSKKQQKCQHQFGSSTKKKPIKIKQFFDSVRKENERVNSEFPINSKQQQTQIKKINIAKRVVKLNLKKEDAYSEQNSRQNIPYKNRTVHEKLPQSSQSSFSEQTSIRKQNKQKLEQKQRQIKKYKQMIQAIKANQQKLQQRLKKQQSQPKQLRYYLKSKKQPESLSKETLNQNLLAFTTFTALVCKQYIRAQTNKDKA